MRLENEVFLITGGGSGLGRAAADALVAAGSRVVIADLPTSGGKDAADTLGAAATFVEADVTDVGQVQAAVEAARSIGALRGVVHTAGRGGAVRLVNKDGTPGDVDAYSAIIHTNLIGSFTVASIAAAAMVGNDPLDGDRGAIVLTSSVAAFEGQIGQAAYASSKAGIVGLTLCAARDLASKAVRVCTIAPGLMDTPLLARLRPDIKAALAEQVPHPARLGNASEFASLTLEILRNGYLNGETFRLDGAIRMAPR